MADISVIKLPNGNSYNLKDTTARSTANSAVPNTRTVNGKALSSNISLGAGDVGAYTKSETDTKINAAVASTYKYKGSVTADKLPTSGQVVGDVYNITNDSSYGKAGMNVAWNGTTWDALGSNVDLSNYVTTSDSRLSNARPASDVYAWAKAAKKPSYSASEINGLGSLATKNGLSAGDVGLGNVANIDQSKAIKSITRNGTTFTATALDGTTSTFTQQDTNTTYGVATSSADGLMSKSDKAKLDGIDPSAITTNAANIKKNADAISAETTRAKAAEKANADTISAEVTRAKKAEGANTQLTNDLKTGLTSGTVKVAKATVADSASSLGKVSTYQTGIPDNGGRRKYLLMYDITDWISAKSNASTRAFDGYFFSRRSGGYVGTNYTGNLSIVASYNGVNSDGSPIKSDNGISLRLRTTSSTYVPRILHQKSNDKYYLSLMTGGSGRDLILFGIFQGTFIGTWINNEGANLSNGTLPSDYEEYSDGFYIIPYERAVCDKNGKDITEYLVAAAYADGAFTFTRGDGGKTVLTIPDAVSNTVNSHIANKSNPHAVTKAQVGLGNVANLDQSKAIKSITRSGTTFTATALDGTTTTFTQQDNNTTYGLASQSSNGLMSAADKKAIDREFFRMVPKGGTVIPNGANLNSTAYLKVGNYYQSANANTTNMTNIPSKVAFMMYVLSPLSEAYDDENTRTWVYRLRIFVEHTGSGIFTQLVSSGTTAGSFDYGPWVKMTNSNDLGAVSNTINTHIANKSNPHGVTKAQVGLGNVDNTADSAKSVKYATSAGSANSVAWGNVSGKPSSLPANGGNSSTVNGHTVNANVPSGAKFTDTTYSVATQSSPGLMSAADKKKLDSYTTGSAGGAVEVTLAAASWSSSTTEINGNNYYTYSVSVANIGNQHPQIFCSGGDSVIPSATQESEFNHIRYALVDTAKSTVTFYSIEKPSVAINVVIKDYLESSIVSGTASVTIATSDWSSTTSTVNGRAFYTAKKTLSSVSSNYPTIICGTADTLPSDAEQTAFDCINYAAADTSTKTVTFYAIQKPTSTVVAIVI